MKRLIHIHTPAVAQPKHPHPHILPDRIYLERAPHPVFGKDGIEVVLAFLPYGEQTPYATWDHTRKGVDTSGDYFHELPEALAGFLVRIGRGEKHKATYEWNGKRGVESMTKVTCRCGFTETCNTRGSARYEYQQHRRSKHP